MIASLPMYLRPENRAAHEALWSATRDRLREAGIAAPDALTHDTAEWETWAREDLVLGQICNLPYRAAFRDKLTLIGTGDYGLVETEPGYYRSVLVMRAEDERAPGPALRLAYSDPLSQSGWGIATDWAAERGFDWQNVLHSGSHIESARAVVQNRADLAFIDAQTWTMLERWEPWTSGLRVVAHGHAKCPGLTFVTAGTVDPKPYRDALSHAIRSLDQDTRSVLGLRSLVVLPDEAYTARPLPPPPPKSESF